jgi:hypothetical protein
MPMETPPDGLSIAISMHIASFLNMFCRLHVSVGTYEINCYKTAGEKVGLPWDCRRYKYA